MDKPAIFLLKRITALYLLLPSFLFAWGWLRQPYATINLLALLFLAFWLVKGMRQSLKWIPTLGKREKVRILVVASVVALWAMFSGVGGFGFQNEDYLASNALLKDLIIQEWPVTLIFKGETQPMTYYMAYYMPAALAGKLAGWNSANIFLFIWTLFGLWLSLAWFSVVAKIKLGNNAKKALALALLFCLAGGLDYFGYLYFDGRPFKLHTHIESWADWFQFSSFSTLLFWVPQHAIAAWLVTGLIAHAIIDGDEIDTLGIGLAASTIWSPFGVVGASPFFIVLLLAYLASGKRRKLLFKRESIILNGISVWLISFHLLFLASSRFSFPAGFIWDLVKNPGLLPVRLAAFWALEFALLAGLLILFLILGMVTTMQNIRPGNWKKWTESLRLHFSITPAQIGIFLFSLCILFALPLFKVGKYNDLVMRGSIPALFIFWAIVVKVVMDASPIVRRKLVAVHVSLLLIIIAGFYPAMSEISRSIRYYSLGPPNYAEVLTSSELDERDILQRMGDSEAFFHRYLGKQP